ncbi:MAG: GtrA family protein [Thaumarchaeota archaeon]|nr:GtrA family protein [Nitrososphaerota archaeon]
MEDPAYEKRRFMFIPHNRYLATGAFLTLSLSILEILRFLGLPFGATLGGLSASTSFLAVGFLTSLTGIGYLGIFVLMTLESASLPIPSEIVLPFAGYLVYLGSITFAGAVIVSTSALLLGALVDYYLALLLGRPVVEKLMNRFGVDSRRLDDGELWVNKKGSWSVLLARFVPGLRSIISLPAGLLKMKLRPFLAMTFLGSLGWSALLIYIGYAAGPLWQSAQGTAISILVEATVIIVAVVSVLYLVFYFFPSDMLNNQTQASAVPSDVPNLFTFAYWQSFIKFNLVGLSGVIVNEGVLLLLTLQGIFFLYSSAAAIEISIISNFFLNDFWTFRDRRSGHIVTRFVKFNGFMLIGLGTNLAIIYFATTDFGLHYAISNLIGIAAAFAIRYGLSVKYTWMRDEEVRRPD